MKNALETKQTENSNSNAKLKQFCATAESWENAGKSFRFIIFIYFFLFLIFLSFFFPVYGRQCLVEKLRIFPFPFWSSGVCYYNATCVCVWVWVGVNVSVSVSESWAKVLAPRSTCALVLLPLFADVCA